MEGQDIVGLRCAAQREVGFQVGAQCQRERHAPVWIPLPLTHNQPLTNQVNIIQPQVADFTEPRIGVTVKLEPSAVACQSTG